MTNRKEVSCVDCKHHQVCLFKEDFVLATEKANQLLGEQSEKLHCSSVCGVNLDCVYYLPELPIREPLLKGSIL